MRDRPSHTALKIAKGLIVLAKDERWGPLLPEGTGPVTEVLLGNAGQLRGWEEAMLHSNWYRELADFAERIGMPGGYAHGVLRKRYIDDAVRAALAGGREQVLLVGAGFDTLCVRLAPHYPRVQFVEIDHPATHDAKRTGAMTMTEVSPSRLHFVGADLARTSLTEAVPSEWDRSKRSVVVAEGLLMYLTEADVKSCLRAVHGLTAPGSQFIFTYLRADEAGHNPLSKLLVWSARLIGEKIQWWVDDDRLVSLLSEHGYTVRDAPSDKDLRARYLEPAGLGAQPLAKHERFVVAETRGESDVGV